MVKCFYALSINTYVIILFLYIIVLQSKDLESELIEKFKTLVITIFLELTMVQRHFLDIKL